MNEKDINVNGLSKALAISGYGLGLGTNVKTHQRTLEKQFLDSYLVALTLSSLLNDGVISFKFNDGMYPQHISIKLDTLKEITDYIDRTITISDLPTDEKAQSLLKETLNMNNEDIAEGHLRERIDERAREFTEEDRDNLYDEILEHLDIEDLEYLIALLEEDRNE